MNKSKTSIVDNVLKKIIEITHQNESKNSIRYSRSIHRDIANRLF